MDRRETAHEKYRRAAARSIRALLWSSIGITIAALVFFAVAPEWLMKRIEAFNGAITIPAGGAIWIAAFIILWLNPMRDVSFQSQDKIEETIEEFHRLKEDAKATLAEAKTMLQEGHRVLDEIRERKVVEKLAAVLEKAESLPEKLEGVGKDIKQRLIDEFLKRF